MTMTEHLASADCSTTGVYYCNPRGFNNEWSILPIPAEFVGDAQRLLAGPTDEGATVLLLPVEKMSSAQRSQVLDWLNQDRTVLTDHWAELTQWL